MRFFLTISCLILFTGCASVQSESKGYLPPKLEKTEFVKPVLVKP